MTENITQVSHMRPFRRRTKQQRLQSLIVKRHQHCPHRLDQMNYYPHYHHQQNYFPTISSAISRLMPIKTTAFTSTTYSGRCFTSTTKKLVHRNHRHSPIQTSAQLMYFSIPLYAVMLLLNLTTINLLPHLNVAEAAAGTLSSAASQATSQANALALSQQQQSNTVIQYQNAATASTTSAIKARYKTMYACEDTRLTMDCEAGSKINLIRANFGRFSITQCNEQGQLDLSIDCMSPITFRIMQERCQDKPRCSVNATSALFGDRCPKTRKYLEVHFQCQSVEPDMVDIRKSTLSPSPTQSQSPVYVPNLSPMKPPNNPIPTPRPNNILPPSLNSANNNYPSTFEETSNSPSPSTDTNILQHQLPTAVMNSRVMRPDDAVNSNIFDHATNKLSDMDNREPIIISMRHLQIENMSRPRCYQWDQELRQWTERGTKILETNQTHTICAFDQASSYVLVMDYSGPLLTISNKPSNTMNQPSTNPSFNSPPQDLLENQPIPIDNNPHSTQFDTPDQIDSSRIIHPPAPGHQQQPQSTATKLFSPFGYLLAIIFVAIGLTTLAFVASSMRSSAGAALKSLGSFTPFNGPKHKQRRSNGGPGMHSNKDLLVINNSNGHQFIYTPASTTKISSSSSTHILTAGQPTGLAGQHQGTLHRTQQQQMYSGNGATLSSLSATGAASNNFYDGLMGLNPLFQQQQQQQQQPYHFSQHHLNQQAQIASHQQQQQAVANYNHQANKSTMSAESANSSSSSSGVESGSTSMQQHQQAHSQQACLVTAMSNNDCNLMSHNLSSNYGHHQQHNIFANSGANYAHQQPSMTLNAHYSYSGGLQSVNDMAPRQTILPSMHSRQASSQLRDHIYESVDEDKLYMARLLMPTNNEQQQQNQHQFGTLGLNQLQIASSNNSRAMTLSTRLLHDALQQQQQQNCNSTVNSDTNRRNYPQPARVRDSQAKTNIICSKLAQVTPQRATEVSSHSGRCDQSTRSVGEHKFARQMSDHCGEETSR